jgi:ElaA protein
MDPTTQIQWALKPFDRLTPNELYQLLRLRSEVFVVEQQCIYLDEDNRDQHAFHLMGWQSQMLAAYSRLFKPGDYFEEASIGRIITAPEMRHKGIGRSLVKKSIEITRRLYGNIPVKIAAQYYLRAFYRSFGFQTAGEIFLEDGIEHIEMILQ